VKRQLLIARRRLQAPHVPHRGFGEPQLLDLVLREITDAQTVGGQP